MENLNENLYVRAASNIYRVLLKTTDRQNNIQRVLCIKSSNVEDVTSNLPLVFSSVMDKGTQCGFLNEHDALKAVEAINYDPSIIVSGIPNEPYQIVVNHGRGTSRRQYIDVNTNVGKVLIRQEILDMVTSGSSLSKHVPTRGRHKTKTLPNYNMYDRQNKNNVINKTKQLAYIPEDIKNFPWVDLKAFIIDQLLKERLKYHSLFDCLPELIPLIPEVVEETRAKLTAILAYVKQLKADNIEITFGSFHENCPHELWNIVNRLYYSHINSWIISDSDRKKVIEKYLLPDLCGDGQQQVWVGNLIHGEIIEVQGYDYWIERLQNAINDLGKNADEIKRLYEYIKDKFKGLIIFKEKYKYTNVNITRGLTYYTGSTSHDTAKLLHQYKPLAQVLDTLTFNGKYNIPTYFRKFESLPDLTFETVYDNLPFTLEDLYAEATASSLNKALRNIMQTYEGEHYKGTENKKFKFESISEAIERTNLTTSCYYIKYQDEVLGPVSYLCLGSYNREQNAFDGSLKSGSAAGKGRNQKLQFLSREDAQEFINSLHYEHILTPVQSKSSSRGVKVPVWIFRRRVLVWVDEEAFKNLPERTISTIMKTCPELRSGRFDTISHKRKLPDDVHFSQTSEMRGTMYAAILRSTERRHSNPNYRKDRTEVATLMCKYNGKYDYVFYDAFAYEDGEFNITRDEAIFFTEEEARQAGEETLRACGLLPIREQDDVIYRNEIEVKPLTGMQAGLPVHGIKVTPDSTTFWFLTEPQNCHDGIHPQGFGSYFKTTDMVPWDPQHPQSFNFIIPNERFRFN